MTEHSPKTAALMAYESGALSKQGRARVEQHLRGCVACQRELATIQAYEATVDVIRDDRGPDLDWSKMERALEREAQVQAKRHRRGWMVPAFGVALAAAAALALALPAGPSPTTVADAGPGSTYVIDRHPADVAPPAPSTVVAHEDAYAHAVITLVAGASEVRIGDAVRAASMGAALASGALIATSATGSLHARLEEGAAIALDPGTELRLGGSGDAAIALDRGRVSVRSARTVILAGQFRIEAEVASFFVDFDEPTGALTVDVREGDVHITGPSVDQRLTGPARFPADAAAIEAAAPVGATESYDAEPSLRVSHTDIVRWEIGDVGVVGSDQIAMRVGQGPLTVSAWDARGRLFRASVDVGAEGLDLSPDDLRPEAPRFHAGTLAREEITPVVHQHSAALQRCYEHQLRVTPELAVHVTARISVEMTGSVADDGVTFVGDEMPAAMSECMSNQIETWIFPAPHGGPVTVGLPFNFEHH